MGSMGVESRPRTPKSRLGLSELDASIALPENSGSKTSRAVSSKKLPSRPSPNLATSLKSPTERRPVAGMRVTTGSLPPVTKSERRPRKSDEVKLDPSLSTSVRNSTTGSTTVGSTGDGSEDGQDMADTVKVLVRIRPPTPAEEADGVIVEKSSSRSVCLKQTGHEAQAWCFDYVADGSTTQHEMFQVAGQPIVEHCIAGYNSSIFAYGQTGAGKTHTMQGSLTDSEQRGLSLRVFEWLFKRIAEEESAAGRDSLKYNCKCSFLEIYNETITDLLKPTAVTLQLREDVTRGCFVDGLSEEIILNAEDAAALIRKGAQNRKIGQTKMNHESSRSHSVFTCTIESAVCSHAGVTQIRFSRLNLVDLAGSERNKSSGATGEHFKEACSINGSLTALGRVIMELVESQRARRQSHIPYRDSKLTFLLQDSLGGNAKSMMIANVGPGASACNETISTLQFVSRAKQIRNKAVVNQDTQAMSMEILKRELQRAYRELDLARAQSQEPLIEEVAMLTKQLNETRAALEEAQATAHQAVAEARLARSNSQWAVENVATLESERNGMKQMLELLSQQLDMPKSGELSLEGRLRSVVQAVEATSQRLQQAEAARDQAHQECGMFSVQLKSLEASTSELEALHRQRLEKGQKDAAESSAKIQELQLLNETLSKGLQTSIDEKFQADAASQHERVELSASLAQQTEVNLGLTQKVTDLEEKMRNNDEAVHKERCQREAVIQELCQEKAHLQQTLNLKETQCLDLQQQVVDARHTSETLQKEASQQSSAIAALEGEREESATRAQEAAATILDQTDQITNYKDQIQVLEDKLTGLSQSLSEKDASLKAAALAQDELRKEHQCSLRGVQQDLAHSQDEGASLRASLESMTSALQLAEAQVQQLSSQTATLEKEKNSLVAELESVKDSNAELVGERDAQAKELDSLNADSLGLSITKQRLTAEHSALQTRIQSMQSQSAAKEQQLLDLRSELLELKESMAEDNLANDKMRESHAKLEAELRNELETSKGRETTLQEDLDRAVKQAKLAQEQMQARAAELSNQMDIVTQQGTERLENARHEWAQLEQTLQADLSQAVQRVNQLEEGGSELAKEHELHIGQLENELNEAKSQLKSSEGNCTDLASQLLHQQREQGQAREAHEMELRDLKKELEQAATLIAASKRAESHANKRCEKYRSMMEDIGSIVKWARSPCTTPRDAASGKGSFLIPASHGKLDSNSLPSKAQPCRPLSPSKSFNSQRSGPLTVLIESDP